MTVSDNPWLQWAEASRPPQSIADLRAASGLHVRGPVVPLTVPGMPLPGKDTLEAAANLGSEASIRGKGKSATLLDADEDLEWLVQQLLYANGKIVLPISVPGGKKRPLNVVSGHLLRADAPHGPQRARVMIVGKMLGQEERNAGRNFVGPAGQLFLEHVLQLGVSREEIESWYVTNIFKAEHPEAATGNTTLRKNWIDEFSLLLQQEIMLVQPEIILCMGSDALKVFLGNKASLKSMQGTVVPYAYRVYGDGGRLRDREASLIACTHPSAVLRQPESEDQFVDELRSFSKMLEGVRPDAVETDIDHIEVSTRAELLALIDKVNRECENNLIAVDAEWNGEHPQNANAYIRTIQLSWRPKSAACIHICHPGGAWRFDQPKDWLLRQLRKLFKSRRIAGHFLTADLEWLLHFGLDLRPQFSVASSWRKVRSEAKAPRGLGGFDTGLAAHAVNETGDFGLTSLMLKYTNAPVYDKPLKEWRATYCYEKGLKAEELEGYGECPDHILVPYGNYDADVTRRLVEPLQAELDADRYGNDSWQAFTLSMRSQPIALEMSCQGLLLDRERADTLTDVYMVAQADLAAKIRNWANWPTLNLNSPYHLRELLFGEKYNAKVREKPTDPYVRLRPKGAKTLGLQPVFTTDKRPVLWTDIVAQDLEDQKKASTNKTSLAILARQSEKAERVKANGRRVRVDLSSYVRDIRNYRFISQVLKTVLRPPEIDETTLLPRRDDQGHYIAKGGLTGVCCADGKVRTHIYQTKETGRWSSARPPLQNLSKRREEDFKKILGSSYLYPLRTMFRADPGHVLIEADYTGAELFGAGIMSGDVALIEHARRNILPESHADYYDIHSNIAKLAFNLDCEPTKAGLAGLGKKNLRIVAKAVVFGLFYGRQAPAIALAVKEEGVQISVAEAQDVIDTIHRTYPGLRPFFEACQQRAVDPHWMRNCFGRLRRFPEARDQQTRSALQRQAMNFPIQSLVAGAMDIAMRNLLDYRQQQPGLRYKFVLQIHDAVLLSVPLEQVEIVVKEVLPRCMMQDVPIFPTDLSGKPTGAGPYHLGIGIDPYIWWGEDLTPTDCLRLGFDPSCANWHQTEGGWVHPEKDEMLWVGDDKNGKLIKVEA